ncbi:MAG TPA: hypothetical protein VNR00_15660 [Opitutus sp.]|nr:hypothetical protein [Opitutus sp.]
MKSRFRFALLVCAVAALIVGPALAAPDAGMRFSQSLPAEEFASSGLARLSSDQIAVLDALVRRDIAQSRLPARQTGTRRFSERLSADERRNAGFDLLTEVEVGQLDGAVERLIAPPPAAAGALATSGSSSAAVTSWKLRRDPQIHGSMTLVVGVGSHGYSEYGGGLVLTYDDPENRYAISVGYAEMHTKGGYPYRGYRDRFYGRPLSAFDLVDGSPLR